MAFDNYAGTVYEANDTVVGNTFRSCGNGTYIDVNLSSIYVYHNNFDNNALQAVDKGFGNSWSNYPCGGNYWSDYNGTDNCWGEEVNGKQNVTGKDMLGDTPYVNGSIIDSYPLMYQWPMPNFWCSEDFNVSAITSSSITNFAFDNTRGMSFDVDTAGTNGSCIMIIPKSLLDGAFNLLVDNVSTGCVFGWDSLYHMLNFTYGPGSHNVMIGAEFINKPPLSDFPDLTGESPTSTTEVRIGLQDLVILANHWGWIWNATYCGPP
jgi:hypothetical protein